MTWHQQIDQSKNPERVHIFCRNIQMSIIDYSAGITENNRGFRNQMLEKVSEKNADREGDKCGYSGRRECRRSWLMNKATLAMSSVAVVWKEHWWNIGGF